MARAFRIELQEDELKMIVAALRQVRYTFEVAHRGAGDEPLLRQYEQVGERYEELHDRLAALLGPPSGEGHLRRVK